MIKLWGRTNSMNVQKVLWVLDALDLSYERIDAGMQFGINTTEAFLRMNPNGKIPLLKDGEFTIWESHAICRYLCNKTPGQNLYPIDPETRGQVDQWIDWTASTLMGPLSAAFWMMVRTPADKQDPIKIQEESAKVVQALKILNVGLTQKDYLAGQFSLADLILAAPVYRCIGLKLIDPKAAEFGNLMAWYDKIKAMPLFGRWVEIPLT